MSFLINAFNTILYEPLFNALVLIYNFIPGHDFGIAIIILTILIRIIFYPLMAQSIKSQKALQDLQPQIQEIQKRNKNNKENQAKEMMALYQDKKINPFGGCLPVLVQLPILIALYRVFWTGMDSDALNHLYSFVASPEIINTAFLGLIDISQPSLIFAFLAGIAQFFQSKMLMPQRTAQNTDGQMAQFSNVMQKQMLYLFPIFTVFILWRLPAAVGIYWITTAAFQIFQQKLILKSTTSEKDPIAKA